MSAVTFQEDAFEIIRSKIDKINDNLKNVDLSILNNLNINEAENLIKLIKKLDNQSNNIIITINNIKNIKINNYKNELIEKELNMKITPIMLIYKTLLIEKYKNFNHINDLE